MDAAGSYALTGVVDPPSLLAAAARDFVGALERATVNENALPTLALLPAGSIAGRVLDHERRPVEDVEITLTVQSGAGPPGLARYQPGGLVTTRTSPRGEFLATGITAGESYRLDWSKPGFAPGKSDLEPLKPAENRSGLELVLETGRKAVGRVTDTADHPIAGALVRLTPVPDETSAQGRMTRFVLEKTEDRAGTTTDGQGGFAIGGLAPGRYDLEAEAEGFAVVTVPGVKIAAGEGAVDLGTVILAAGVSLEGRVIDAAGLPLEGAEIRIFESTGMPFLPSMMILRSADQPVKARSGTEGRFRLRGLAAGVAVGLVVGHEGFITTATGGVVPPQATPVEIVLQPASRLSGRVLDGARRPVVGATVMVFRDAAGPGSFAVPVRGRSDAEGGFVLEGVEPGRVKLSAIAGGFQDLTLSGLEVPVGGALEGLELVLSPGAVVEGTVLDTAGNPLIGVMIRVIGWCSMRVPRCTARCGD